jgi:signal transduction histidine kinase
MAGAGPLATLGVVMRARLGLQGRMTVSYVVATVAIVVFVEALAGAFVLPHITTGQDVSVRALDAAEGLAKRLGGAVVASGTLEPLRTTPLAEAGKASAGAGEEALVLDTTGRIAATSTPGHYPLGADATDLLPAAAVAQLRAPVVTNAKLGTAAVAQQPNGKRAWALVPVRVPIDPGTTAIDVQPGKGAGTSIATVGFAYVETPAAKGYVLAHKLGSGALVLLLTVPVGVLFGLATTHGLRRRLRRLADASRAVARGDFATRVVPAAGDEVGQLEQNFNEMTARLGEASRRERELASQNAKLAERSRISRELHDSISQELFSLALLAGGLERALPDSSPLQPQINRIVETVATAVHEMRALVLDLHPSALEEKGLQAALEDVCAAYRSRKDFELAAVIEPVGLESAAQHAVLRVAQEALANATKHASATRVVVSLRAVEGGAELTVSDDGRGFAPALATPSSGVGLRLMRERVSEIGGAVTIDSAPGQGTKVRVIVPSSPAEQGVEPARLTPAHMP